MESSVMPGSVVELSLWLFDRKPPSYSTRISPSAAKETVEWNGKGWQVKTQDSIRVSAFAPLLQGGVTSNNLANKRKSNQERRPIGTGFLGILNAGVGFWLWNAHVDPERVALNR